MSTLSIEVEIVDGKVTPVGSHLLPESGRGILTLVQPADAPLRKSAELIEGPHGLLIFHGTGGTITPELIREIEEDLDAKDAARR